MHHHDIRTRGSQGANLVLERSGIENIGSGLSSGEESRNERHDGTLDSVESNQISDSNGRSIPGKRLFGSGDSHSVEIATQDSTKIQSTLVETSGSGERHRALFETQLTEGATTSIRYLEIPL